MHAPDRNGPTKEATNLHCWTYRTSIFGAFHDFSPKNKVGTYSPVTHSPSINIKVTAPVACKCHVKCSVAKLKNTGGRERRKRH